MTHQRRRYGKPVVCFPSKKTIDRDGAEVRVPDFDNPIYPGNGMLVQDRAQRAEVPGQVQVRVERLQMPFVPGIDSWWRIRFNGKEWDVVGPPNDKELQNRHSKHTSVLIRERAING